ncbi:MAG TPA: flavodoxin family protein [Prolixibacteraceae bacterium]|nr:flavodoxin family protein [Prolixibacteraceae bacterium]
MKVTAFVGSARKKHTYDATVSFLEKLQAYGDVETELVRLSDYDLKTCRGCRTCFDVSEDKCPLKDDRDILFAKMRDSDGIVFATPNYSFQVSGHMKKFLDRLGYVFHRPEFFGRAFTGIVTQGIYGGDKIVKYLSFAANGLGFNIVNGTTLMTIEPVPEDAIRKNEAQLTGLASRFYDKMKNNPFPSPSLFKLMMFRMARTSMHIMLDDTVRDFKYYRDKGWWEAGYYYPVKLSPFKGMLGNLFDRLAARTARKGRVGLV